MNLQIFDVAHGACASLTCDNGTRLMIDCGHNSETGWQPGTYLRNQGISHLDLLAITNYDEDHVSGLPNLLKNVRVNSLWRNTSITPDILKAMKFENGMGYGIKTLIDMMYTYTSQTANSLNFLNVERYAFCNSYPTFTDTNNLSMVIHLKVAGINFLFPGDLERGGWGTLLQRQGFCNVISQTHVLMAPHHGRESGIYPEIFTDHRCKPYYVVMSDKCHMYDTQRTIDYYSSKATGGSFRNSTRHVLTTRKDGCIRFQFSNNQWHPS